MAPMGDVKAQLLARDAPSHAAAACAAARWAGDAEGAAAAERCRTLAASLEQALREQPA